MSRPYDRRYDPSRHVADFVTVPRRGPRVVSIKELRWNARLGVVTQLVYIVGRLPRLALVLALVGIYAGVLLVLALVAAFWPYLLALVLVLVAGRLAIAEHRRRVQRQADYDDIPF